MYNFDTLTTRRGSDCYKWDLDKPSDDILPMWVADMDFPTAPKIIEAISHRVSHGIFGYTRVPQSFYDSIVGWYARRYACHVAPDSILYTSGVVPAVSAIIKALTSPSDKVVVLTPVYNCFFSSIRNNGCQPLEVPLLRTADSYVVDFDALSAALAQPEAKILLLCSPHNPAGRVWSSDELTHIGRLCLQNNVILVSDEIHSGLIMPGHTFVPFASLAPDIVANSITTSSSSKSFNTAGLQISYIFTDNELWRQKIDRAININEVCDVNPFGIIALQTAYNECEDYLEELCRYIFDNYQFVRTYLAQHLPKVQVIDLQGTYLVWLDVRSLKVSSNVLHHRLLSEGHLRLSPGNIYGLSGEGYMRLNIATQRSRLAEGLRRLVSVLAPLQ